MIAVNNIKINLKDESNVYAKEIRDGIKFIKQSYKFPLIFTFPKRLQRTITVEFNSKVPGSNAMQKTEHPAARWIKFKETIETAKGAEEWTYYEISAGVGDKQMFYPEGEFIERSIIVQESNIEKAFFLLYKSRYCETSLNPDINNLHHEKHFCLENPKFDAFVKVKNEAPRIKVEGLVMIEHKDLPEKQLRTIAIEYGINNALDMEPNPIVPSVNKYILDINECRVNLMNIIHAQYKTDKDSYNKFLEKVGLTSAEMINLQELIQKLYENKIIELVKTGPYKKWVFSQTESDDELKGAKIITCKKGISQEADCIKDLAVYLEKENTVRELLQCKWTQKEAELEKV